MVIDPDVPVIVAMPKVPTGCDASAVTVSVEVALPLVSAGLIVAGEKVAVNPLGNPLIESDTSALKPANWLATSMGTEM